MNHVSSVSASGEQACNAPDTDLLLGKPLWFQQSKDMANHIVYVVLRCDPKGPKTQS